MTKKLRWAVVGPPSSGKTYLLSDLIKAFGAMGYECKKLPVTSPYSSFGTFFYESGNVDGGGMAQTLAYACREDNHYHALLQPKGWGRSVEVDFLNIPGETFADNEQNTIYFNNLADRIRRMPKGYFQLTTYHHPCGSRKLVLEQEGTTEEDYRTEDGVLVEGMYRPIGMVHQELHRENYHRGESRKIKGKRLLRDFFEIIPDSIFDTFKLTWKRAFHGMRLEDYEEMLDYKFYFLLYCQKATDIILCERLYKPVTESDSVSDVSVTKVMEMMSGFISHSGARPHVYLAFRGTDFLLGENEELLKDVAAKAGGVDEVRYSIYDYFCQCLLKEHFGYMGSSKSCLDAYDQAAPFQWKVKNGKIPGRCDLDEYIRMTIGTGMGQGFWSLLSVAKDGSSNFLTRMMPGYASMIKISNSQKRPWIPPHVYFTATPVDAQVNVYENDRRDHSRFIYEDCDKKIKSFHIEMEDKRAGSLLFGTYQLLADLLLQHGICVKGSHAEDGLLGYFNEKNINSFL